MAMEIKRSRHAPLTMAERLRGLTKTNRGQRLAKIESAVALSGNLKARLREDLMKIYGPLTISFIESPALIGGMRITVGSDLYDGSVKGTLAALEAAFRD
jgi:F-type H+-transporting ATPase subunit delta